MIPPLIFFVLSPQSLKRGGSSNVIPQQQVCTSTEDSSGRVWNQRKWNQHFQSQDNNRIPTGGTGGNALALFPPAVVCRCVVTTHDAANERCCFFCFFCLGEKALSICSSRSYVIYFVAENWFFYLGRRSVRKVGLFIVQAHWSIKSVLCRGLFLSAFEFFFLKKKKLSIHIRL